MMISYAQNFEDVMLERALAEIENGFYVDVGAWHPDLDSVTRHFFGRGWRGVNIENVFDHFLVARMMIPAPKSDASDNRGFVGRIGAFSGSGGRTSK
jgi:hypothetical protein